MRATPEGCRKRPPASDVPDKNGLVLLEILEIVVLELAVVLAAEREREVGGYDRVLPHIPVHGAAPSPAEYCIDRQALAPVLLHVLLCCDHGLGPKALAQVG